MTDPTPTPKRRHRAAPPPALAPGLYLVGRFGDVHDLLGPLGEVASPDLAAAQGYLNHAHQVTRMEIQERTIGDVLRMSYVRPPDLRDVNEADASIKKTDAEIEADFAANPAVMAKVDEALADPAAFVAAEHRENRRKMMGVEPSPQPVIIEETVGVGPATARRPPMPWDDDAKDDPWQNTPA